MIVLCSGVMRSASTWSFNVCRALVGVIAHHLKAPFGADYRELESLDHALFTWNPKAMGVIKAHRLTDYAHYRINAGDVINVCTVRDPRDCIASRQQFKAESLDDSIRLVKSSFIDPMRFENGLFLDYEDIITDPKGQIRAMSAYVGLHPSEPMVDEIHESLKPESVQGEIPDQEINPVYHYHPNHLNGGVSGRFRTELSERDQKRACAEVRRELDWYRTIT